MLLHKYARNLIFVLIFLYSAINCYFERGSIGTQVLLLLILAISFYYLLKSIVIKNNYFYYSWTIFLLLNIVGFILNADFTSSIFVNQLKGVLICSIVFYPVYYFSRMGIIKTDHFIRYVIAMIPFLIYQFYRTKQAYALLSIEHFTNNEGYLFASLVPFIFISIKKNWFSFLLIIIIGYFTVQSAKRGALLIYILSLIIYVPHIISNQLLSANKGIIKKIFIFLFTVLGLYCFYYFYQNNEYLLHRIDIINKTGGSGREIIYTGILKYWTNSDNFINYFFGFGFAGTVLVLGTWAHNDWLQILFDYGLLGLFIYFNLYISLLYIYFVEMKHDEENKYLYISLFVSCLLASFYSMWFASATSYIQSMLLGYLTGYIVKDVYVITDSKQKYSIYK